MASIAGTGGHGLSGDGGPAILATFSTPSSLAFDAAGNLYFDDSSNYRVRKVAAGTGIISTVVGNGEYVFCGEGVPARTACLSHVFGIDFDSAGNVLFTQEAMNWVRQVSADGTVSTLGTSIRTAWSPRSISAASSPPRERRRR
jgi:hypothetical protein